MNKLLYFAAVGVGLAWALPAFPAAYYVDDGITNGNVYVTAPGNDANSGTLPSLPKRTITNLLASVTLTAGDIVYIDTGIYSNYTVNLTNNGALGNPIVIQGSTNIAAGGTIISRDNAGFNVFFIQSAQHLSFRDLILRRGNRAFSAIGTTGISLDRVMISENSIGLGNGNWTIRRSVFLNNNTLRDPAGPTSFNFDNCVIWGSSSDVASGAPVMTISNSVYVGGDILGNIIGDYNVFWNVRLLNQNRAYLYEYDMPNSTYLDPGFASPTTSNFYPVSVIGRYNSATGAFVTDLVHSVLIDFGDTASTLWTNEATPNGDRINAGAFGGTVFASKSRTNAWLLALTFNDGGAITGTTQNLVWNQGGFTNGATVRLQYSTSHGVTWSNIVTGIPVTNRMYNWNVGAMPPDDMFWRVVSESNTNIISQSRQQFVVGNARVPFYVNDAVTNGDVFVTAPGSDANDGLTPFTPKASLTNLLVSYVLGKHDVIYVDTGIYSNYTVTISRYGVDNQPLIIQGAPAAGATVFRRNANAAMFQLLGTNVMMRNLTIESSSSVDGAINGGNLLLENSIVRSNNVAFRRVTLVARNTLIATNNFVINSDGGSFNFDQCVFWRNGQTQASSRPWSVSNSVIVGGTVSGLGSLTGGDRTVFWDVVFSGYPNLSEMQRITGQWIYSTVLDPLFANPAAGDFHPQSVIGRFNPSNGLFVADAQHSPLIDFGNPASTTWTNETMPNGGRVNAGVYGGTALASRSRTNAWLQTLSLNDGGTLNVPGETVYWNAGGLPTGATVRIEFSFNSGFSWNVFLTNISASAGFATINNTNFSSSRLARWRIVLESNPSVAVTNRTDFTYRSGVFTYFVNDDSTAGDVYTTAVGNDANIGTTPDSPRATLTSILTNFALGPGDVVYVDTGLYLQQSTVTIPVTLLVSGTNGNPVIIQGSTNVVAGGTIFRAPLVGGNTVGITFSPGVQDVELRDLIIQRRTIGISLNGNTRITLRGTRLESNTVNGISAVGVTNLTVRNSTIRANGQDGLNVSGASDVSVLHSALWMNNQFAILTAGARVMVTNSILGARGTGRAIYNSPALTNIIANYNALRVESNASVAVVNALDRALNTLSAWQAETSMDRMSLDGELRAVNPDQGDFRLRSQAVQGRFDPILGWVTDTVTSPLIDAGDPTFPFSVEPAPNGGRVNIGVFGNTFTESRSDLPRLFAGNLQQGGFVRGTSVLHWVAAGLPTNGLVQVEVSVDGGESWMLMTTGVLASVEQFSWNTTTNAPSVAGLWRVRSVSNPSVINQTTNFFGLRNVPLNYYINDGSTNGLLFTTAAGATTNWVATPQRPLSGLGIVFDRYDLEPGDRIFVDRGSYVVSNSMVVGSRHSGAPTSGAVVIIGATTCAGGATPASEFFGTGAVGVNGLQLDNVRHMVVSNLLFRNIGSAVNILRGQNITIDGLRVESTGTNAVFVNQSTNVVIQHALVKGSAAYGWFSSTNTSTRLINSVLLSNKFGGVFVAAGTAGITNSVIIVNEPGLTAVTLVNNALMRSDYNNYRIDALANTARNGARTHKFLFSWQQETTNDLRSMTHEPNFADVPGGDYHLRSAAGRYDAQNCGVATDAVTSVMLDAGDPSFAFSAEPTPNGNRINVGLYGGSVEASRSPTNGVLLTLTLNRGGTIRGTNALYWFANQVVTGHLVSIDVSLDNGVTWTNIATNVAASAGSYNWNSSDLLSSAIARWRIRSQTDLTLSVTNESPFTINNGAIAFYVNDVSTNGDLYAAAAGHPDNDGLSANTPNTSISFIFNRYQPQPGDIVYVDTGNYTFSAPISLDANISGLATNPIVIQGSTNVVGGGARINMNRQGPLFQMNGIQSVFFNDLILTNARYGFVVQLSSNITFNNIHIAGITNLNDSASQASVGIRSESSSAIELNRLMVQGISNRSESAAILIRVFPGSSVNPGLHTIRNSILWSNAVGIWAQANLPIAFSNSIIEVVGTNHVAVRLPNAAQFFADYNNYRVRDGARLAELRLTISTIIPEMTMPINFTTMQAWREYSGRDVNSLTYDPRFANPRELDFGLSSTAGRWTPSGFVTDLESSMLIDAGNPQWSFAQEPAPNGGRVNLGHQANNAQASLSSSNKALVLLSLYDGGVATGNSFPLRWDLRGDYTSGTVRLQISTNAGLSWTSIATNVPATNRIYLWDTALQPSGHQFKWRIQDEVFILVSDISDLPFAVRNTNFAFYVNDDSTAGDIYTSQAGSAVHSGTSPNQPKASLQDIWDTYTLYRGDTIYVDTGIYSASGNIRITPRDEYLLPGVVSIIGSTNRAEGGSVLLGGGIIVRDNRDLVIRNFNLRGISPAGFNIHSSSNIVVESVQVAGAGHGLFFENSVDVRMRYATVIGSRTNGLELFNINRRIAFDQGLVWTNSGFAVNPVGNLSISNSVLAASGNGKFIYGGASNPVFHLNHNVYFTTNGARLARISFGQEPYPREFANLSGWRIIFSADLSSHHRDPLLADPPELDFHARSSGGRWLDSITNFVFDDVTSPAVDTGTPSYPFENETMPNGGRLNIGPFGNTPQASRSPATSDYLTVTASDGGSVSGTNVILSWVARGAVTGHASRVEVSVDGGLTWSVLASNIPPTSSSVSWNTTGLISTVLGYWRVRSEVQPGVVGVTPRSFAIRNGPVLFYMNDHNITGDVYCVAAGSPTNNGVSAASPLDSLADMLNRYSIEPGDILYMDTGIYSNSATIVVDQLDAGFRLIGSTNSFAGGTRLLFTGTTILGMQIRQAPNTRIENLRFGAVETGLQVTESPGVILQGLTFDDAGTGVSILESANVILRNSSVRNSDVGINLVIAPNVYLNHLVLWSNRQAGIRFFNSSAILENSVLGIAGGPDVTGFDLDTSSTLVSDYNWFDRRGEAVIARRLVSGSAYDLRWQRVALWSRDTGNDLNSLNGDPGFADADSGDFHPRSQAGRYHPTTGTLVNDPTTSLLVDNGAPLSLYNSEPLPNGGRADIGMYGNSPESSRSPTNARLVVARLNDGGRAEGASVPLTWSATGVATGHTVRIEVSVNNGSSWSVVQSNVPAQAGTVFWNSGTNGSWFGRWRVTSQTQPSLSVTNLERFAVRNTALSLFMNDNFTGGDVYTSAPGNENNTGTTPTSPRLSLESLLSAYDLEPGDTIYIDTGEYILSSTIQIGRYDAWNAMNNVVPLQDGGVSVSVIGSTNEAAQGTRFLRSGLGNAFELNQALGFHLAHIRIQHTPLYAGYSIDLNNSPYALIEFCQVSDGARGLNIFESREVRIRNLLARNHNQYGVLVRSSVNVDIRQSVLWSNTVGLLVESRGSVKARNNAVIALTPNSAGWQRNDGPDPIAIGTLDANYNLLWATNNAFLAEAIGGQYPAGRRRFERLINWINFTGVDRQSLASNPRFFNPNGGDFHPRSPHGRFVVGSGYVTNGSEQFSKLIDVGDPSSDFIRETPPNGQRVNVGLYGNTSQSSLSPSNGLVQVLSFNDGGSSSGEILLEWVAAGPAASHLVTLEFSNNGGATWTNIVSNLPASDQQYLWNSSPYGSAAAGVWRVISQSDTNVSSRNERFFSLRQFGSIPYFINDNSTVGDVYTTAPGNDDNNGVLPDSPKASLQSLLDAIDLEPGDVVYMDTGVYSRNLDTVWDELDGGGSTNPVILRGSTNFAAGGTSMNRQTSQGSALVLSRLEGLEVRDITFSNGAYGITAQLSQNVHLKNIRAAANRLAGLFVSGSSTVLVENSTFWNNSTNGILISLASAQQGQQQITQPGFAVLRNNTIWGSRNGVRFDIGGSADLRNNLIRANGPDARIYFMDNTVQPFPAEYNAYFRQNGALMAERTVLFGGNEYYTRLIDWQRFSGYDLYTLSHEPLVANPAIGDFHLQSANGRVLPSGGLTFDPVDVFSPLLDTGDPEAGWNNEPAPNGSRIDIGNFGNTAEASRSRTTPWLLTLTFNDGGRASGTNVLRWASGGWPSNALVRLEFANNGVDYAVLASNISVSATGYVWDASAEPTTQFARWRVCSEIAPFICSAVQNPFIVKNANLVVYVNDGSPVGDVYTCGLGNPTNSGVNPCFPLDDPVTALERYPFSEGDILYIDTGIYSTTNTFGMTLGLVGDILEAGKANDPIRIIGSTNFNAGGSWFTSSLNNSNYGIRIFNTEYVTIENINISGFSNGIWISGSKAVNVEKVIAQSSQIGFYVDNSISSRFVRCVANNNSRYGLLVDGSFVSASWDQGVIWSNRLAGIRHTFGSLSVSNSIIVSGYTNSLLYEINSGFAVNRGDNNVYWPSGGPVLMNNLLGNVNFGDLRFWQNRRNMDTNSFVEDPRFADPGAGNFRLMSQRGRYQPLSGTYIQDAASSWAIDAGGTGHAFGLEPAPNGARLNIGLYGNTPEASLSPTNREVFVVSMRDGGTAGNPQPLIWLTRGMTMGDTVRIEYSPNDEIDWYVLATNLPALQREYMWTNSIWESTPLGRWRVILESQPSVQDMNPQVFTLRNSPIPYYVNDLSTVGDVFTAVPGSPLNNGITVSTPVHSVSTILQRYRLEGGDTIYVDTGYYSISNNIIIRADDSGNITNRVVVMGSPNRLAGGTHFFRTRDTNWTADFDNNHAVFELVRAARIELADMILENGNMGVYVNNPQPQEDATLLRNLDIRNSGFAGVRFSGSSGSNTLERVLARDGVGFGLASGASTLNMISSVLWSNKLGAVSASSTILAITNSVLEAHGDVTIAVLSLAATRVISDYNNYFAMGEASYAIMDGELITGLPQWTVITTQDLHTISVDPLFANPTNHNFYPQSPSGRFDPLTSLFVTNDTQFSWLLDTGDPRTSFTNEPDPNGGRRNLGLYGDTLEASKSRTQPWLLAVTAMAGGRIGNIFPVHWFYGNLDVTNRVDLHYSVDSGTNWYPLAVSLPIDQDGFLWNSLATVPFNQSPTTKWKVTLVGNTNIYDETDRTFGLNGPFRFFINDDSTVGDEFTTVIGNDNNLGISSNAPKATLRAILDGYDIDPDDFVYVDTGNYIITSNDIAVLRLNNRGANGQPVTILGSTNRPVFDGVLMATGDDAFPTVIDMGAPYIVMDGVNLRRARIEGAGTNVTLRNLYVDRGVVDISGSFSEISTFSVTNGRVDASGPDFTVQYGYVRNGLINLSGPRALLRNTVVSGDNSPLVRISGTNITVINNTLVADRTAVMQDGIDSRSILRNNILVADGAMGTAFAIETRGGVVISDYNLFYLRNNAWYGSAQEGLWERLLYWQIRSGQDTNSLYADPLFANEAGGDYRVKSLTGRYQNGIWVTDGQHSAAIDAGAPFDSFGLEPDPNGGRINIGAYGNTEQASKSRTEPWLLVMTMNDGGAMRGTNILRWLAGAMSSTNRVTLQYSPNRGTNWITIAGGQPVFDGAYIWDTTTASNTLDALWRVVLEGDPGVFDESDAVFNIRNDVRAFYVNNASTNGNVFTIAPGNPLNDGRSPSTPKATLQDVLATYDTEPFDTIYVDTGIYTSPVIQVIWSRGGDSNANMTIRGSTNLTAGGSVIRRPIQEGGALVVNASFVTIRDLIFESAGQGLVLETNHFNLVREVEARSNVIGVAVIGGGQHAIQSSRLYNNLVSGVEVRNANQVAVENISFVNNLSNSVALNNSPNATIQNNIFYHDVATSNSQSAIAGNTGGVFNAFIDYNVYFFGPLARSNTFIYGAYTNLLSWQRERFKDFRSAITNPLFVSVASNNFFLQSQAGRYNPATRTFVNDTNTSWAIDKGNPFLTFTNEPMQNGGRINIGAYGNTIYASKGTTNPIVFARTANEVLPVAEAENPYPLIWYLLNVPFNFNVSVQYSGDGGFEWTTLQSGVPAYQEYILWTNFPTFNSFNAKWRIVGEGGGNTNYWDINDGQIRTFFGVHRITSITPQTGGTVRIIWRGAWDEDYQIQFATNNFLAATNMMHQWQNLGPITNLTLGGDTPFTDLNATNSRFRVYRVIWMGTNGLPYQ